MDATLRVIKSMNINEFVQWVRGSKPGAATIAHEAFVGSRITRVYFDINRNKVDLIQWSKFDTYRAETAPSDEEIAQVVAQFEGQDIYIESFVMDEAETA